MPTENEATPHAAHEAKQQDDRIQGGGDVRDRNQDEHQPPHADDRDAEQHQHRQAAADLVYPCAERNAEQRARELRGSYQQADEQRRELHGLLECVCGGPVKRDRCETDEV